MPSQIPQNALSCNERKIVVELLGMIARILELNGIDGKKEVYNLYAKLK